MKSALLVIDVQQGLCSGPWAMFDIDAVVDRINEVIGRAREAGVPVILVQHEDDGPMGHGSHDWRLYDRLAAHPDDLRIRKTTPDSFHRTELLDHLETLGVEQLVVCGLQSEFCVDSTVRGALAHGYPVTLIADAHSTMDNDVLKAAQITAHHNATLANVDSFEVRVSIIPAAELRIDV